MFQRHRGDVNTAGEEQQNVSEHFNNNTRTRNITSSRTAHTERMVNIIWTRQLGNKRAGTAFIVFLLNKNSSSAMSTFHKALHSVAEREEPLLDFTLVITEVKTHAQRERSQKSSPRYASSLHVVGQSDIMWPNIILPFLETNYATEHIARVHSNTHVNVNACGISHLPVTTQHFSAL